MSRFYNSFQKHVRYPTSLFNVLWETTKSSVILPFNSHPDMPFINDPLSYEDWKKNRDIDFWYRTTKKESAHGGTDLRHLPIKHHDRLFGKTNPKNSVGFTLPRHSWFNGWGRSKFCLIIRGDSPSSHAWIHSIRACCIPIFISDHFVDVALPFGEGKGPPFWLKLEDFAFVFGEKRVLENSQRMVQIIENTNATVLERKLKHLLEVRRLLLYDHPQSLVLEALVWGQINK